MGICKQQRCRISSRLFPGLVPAQTMTALLRHKEVRRKMQVQRLKTRIAFGAKAAWLKGSQHFARLRVGSGFLKAEQILKNDGLAVQALNLGNMRHFARAIAQARL